MKKVSKGSKNEAGIPENAAHSDNPLVYSHQKKVFGDKSLDLWQWQVTGIRIFCLEGRLADSPAPVCDLRQENATLVFVQKGGIRVRFDGNQQDLHLGAHMQNSIFALTTRPQLWSDHLDVHVWGVEFSKALFLEHAREGGSGLQEFAVAVAAGLPSTLFSRPAFIPLPIQACLRSIMATAANPDGMALYLRSKAMELLAHQSLHSSNENAVRQRIVKTDYDRERLLFAKEYLLQRMAMPPSLADLARIAGINEFKLKRGFKELFGNTVFGYLADARLDLALSELEKGRKTITEIAFELGFSSLQHFSTAFKKRHGIAPTRFKQS